MADKKFIIELDFQAKNLLSIEKKIQDVKSLISKNGIAIGFDPSDISKMHKDLDILNNEMQKAFSSKTNKIDYSKVYSGMKTAKVDVYGLEASLSAMGVNGKDTFDKLYKSQYNFAKQTKETNGWASKLNYTLMNTVRWRMSNATLNAFSGQIQKAYYFAKDLDTSLNNIRIVSGKTNQDMLEFAQKANEAAKALKIGTLEYTDAALVFFQQGMNSNDVEKMTRATLIGANITGESAEEMSTLLTATMNGYKKSANEAMEVTDMLSAVGATTAADYYELATAMAKVSSIAKTAGIPMESLSAQIATIVSVTKQAPENVGNALKTIYTRMLAFRNESKGMMVDEDGESFGVPSVEAALSKYNAATGEAISLFEASADGTKVLRNLDEVIQDIGDSWQKTNDKNAKFGIATSLAGSRQQNNLIALFDTWDQYKDTVGVALDSEGTALEQQAIYMTSYKGSVKSLQTTLEAFYMEVFNVDQMKDFVGMLEGVVKTLTDIVKIAGGMPTMLGLGMGMGVKSVAQKPLLAMYTGISRDKNISPIDDDDRVTSSDIDNKIANIRNIYSEEHIIQLEQERDKVIEVNREYAKLETTMRLFENLDAESGNLDLYLSALEDNLHKLSFVASDLIPDLKGIQEIFGESIPKGLDDEIEKFIIALKKINPESETAEDDIKDLYTQYDKLTRSIEKTKNAMLEADFGTNNKDTADSILKSKEANKEDKNNNFKNIIDNESEIAEKTMKAQQAVASFTMVFSSLNMIWANETIPLSEKFTDSIGAIGSSLLMNFDTIAQDTMKAYQESLIKVAEQQIATGVTGEIMADVTVTGFAKMKLAAIAFGETLLKAIPMLIAISALSAVFVLAGKGIDAFFTSAEEQADKVQEVRAAIGGLKSEIEELENADIAGLSDDQIKAQEYKLEILKKQLLLQEKQLDVELKLLASSELFGKGDKNPFTSGVSGELTKITTDLSTNNKDAMGYASDDMSDAGIQKQIEQLSIYESTINDAELKLMEYKDVLGENSDEYKKLKGQIDGARSATLAKIKAIAKAKGIEESEVELLIGLTDTTDDLTVSLEDETAAYEKLNNSLKDLTTSYDTIQSVQDEYNETGRLSSATISDLMTKYPELNELLAKYQIGLASTSDVIEALKGDYANDTEAYRASLFEKLIDDEEFLKNLQTNHSDLFKNLIEVLYKGDLTKFKSLSQAKYDIEQILVQQLGKLWSKYYDVTTGATNQAYDDMQARRRELEQKTTFTNQTGLLPNKKGQTAVKLNKKDQAEYDKIIEDSAAIGRARILQENAQKAFDALADGVDFSFNDKVDTGGADDVTKKLDEQFQKRLQLSQNYIEDRNLYEDWHKFGDDEVSALQRMVVYTNEYYAKKLMSAELYASTIRSLNQSIYNAQKTQAEKLKEQQEKTAKDYEDAQSMLIDYLKDYYDLQQDLEDEKHKTIIDNIDDEISAMKAKYALEDYRNSLQNQDKAILKKQAEINALALDNSIEANARKAALQEELDELLLEKSESVEEQKRKNEEETYNIRKDVEDERYEHASKKLKDLSSDVALFNQTQIDLADETTAKIIEKYQAMGNAIGGAYESAAKKAELLSVVSAVKDSKTPTTPTTAGSKYYLVNSDWTAPPEAQNGDLIVTGAGIYKKGTPGLYQELPGGKHFSKYPELQAFYKANYPQYKDGGMVTKTGLIWGDGTKTKPEYMLKNMDFMSLTKIMDAVQLIIPNIGKLGSSNLSSNQNNQNSVIHSEVNIYSVPNENVNSLADRVKKEIWLDFDKQLGLVGIR